MQRGIFNRSQYLAGNELAFVAGGMPYFTCLLQIINEAQKQIHLQVYIFDEDDTGKEVATALKSARQRGVDIYLAVDSYGSKDLSPAFIKDLKDSGINFRFFSPLPKRFYILRLGRRLHSKVVVADQEVALVGGVNISDKYRGTDTEAPWLDFAITVKGPVSARLARISEQIYREKYLIGPHIRRKKSAHPSSRDVLSRPVLNDWFRGKRQIGAGYRAAFRKAQHSITVVASYFLPSRSIRTALKRAARRGVQVNLLLPGISDVPMAKRAIRYLYQEMLEVNIQIYEWETSILHGKMAIVDNKWVTLGSYNLNHLSQYSSIELNLEVLDDAFAASVQRYLSTLLSQSTLIDADAFRQKMSRMEKILDWASYTLGRWIMSFLFFLVRREHRYKEKE
ncbi:MAG: phospholipase D-like domain-containing protein [Saprospiraceae bacterium]|nr:phospholipase D-like domain-containing protein [Saprospiraceae bacterium]MDZ4703513.1 phospholipase D-like domain-containing protein [Saprospiraceae bacterium]